MNISAVEKTMKRRESAEKTTPVDAGNAYMHITSVVRERCKSADTAY